MRQGEKKPFYIWFVITGFLSTAAFWLYYTGLGELIYQADATRITSLIAVLFVFVHFWMGRTNWHIFKDIFYAISSEHLQAQRAWVFIPNQLTIPGLIGTVIGFILLMLGAITNLGVTINDTAGVQELFGQIGIGMGTALYTTAVGLIGAIILRSQVALYSHILKLQD